MSKPFENEGTIAQPKIGLKKSDNKSIFDQQAPKKPEKAQQEEFRERASQANDRLNSYNVRAMEAVSSFMKLLDNQTLSDNKSVFAVDLEKEIINKFQALALDMDADPLQPDGMGSVGAITFLLKIALLQRDKINQLEYRLTQLNTTVKEIALRGLDKQSDQK